MKLTTKLTAICAALVLTVAASLSGLMLWQVREQSYNSLEEHTQEKLNDLVNDFLDLLTFDYSTIESPYSQKVYLQYHFQNFDVEGSVLGMNGELITSPTKIDPRHYMELTQQNRNQTVRCSDAGKHYLVLGRALEYKETIFQVFLIADATYIHQDLGTLLVRFVMIAVFVCVLGLLCVLWLIRKTMAPLAQLQKTADRIASGKYGERVDIHSRDEVGMLAENFNRMAVAVEDHVQSLTEQNERQQLFIGSVTHEFKTPLTSLLLNVDTLRNVYLPEEMQQDLLESMDGQLHWLEQMVHKLLKLISLHQSVQIKQASVQELLEQVRKITQGAMQKHGTVLEVSCKTETLPMDKDLLCSALVNLIENSAKASSPGQVIHLRAEGNVLEVSDSGRGIPQKDLERVTEPFYMCDPSRSKTKGGFGLGLALVKEIAAVHRAALDIQSTPGAGTTAKMTFPANGNETVISQ